MDSVYILLYGLAIYMMGHFDRISGDSYDLGLTKWAERLMYGWMCAAVVGHPFDIFTLASGLAIALGRAPGWGEPIGAALERRQMVEERLEWWQIGPAARHTWVALWARGAMWGMCFLPLAWFDHKFLAATAAFTIALPAAILIERLRGTNNWEWQERFRGWIAGILCKTLIVGANLI